MALWDLVRWADHGAMRKQLTVGIDGSETSLKAMDWAADEAERRSAAVKVVACVAPPTIYSPWYSGVPYDMDEITKETTTTLQAAIERAQRRHPGVTYDDVVLIGHPRAELAEAAAGSELLVVGTRGVSAFGAWLLGSVAHTVVRTSPCPVVLVPDYEPEAAGRRGAIQQVVVGVDGSPASDVALAWAVEEADLRDGDLHIVHTWQYLYGSELASVEAADLMRVDAATVLDRALEFARERVPNEVVGELVEGPAMESIVAAAEQADLVVLGSRGRGGLRTTLFGSVAHSVVNHSPTPVVVVRDLLQ
jgi:nucleotide-binding universal stress UspA family protein